jgi:hypothetical protein
MYIGKENAGRLPRACLEAVEQKKKIIYICRELNRNLMSLPNYK